MTSTLTETVTSTSAQGGSLSGGVQDKRDKKMGYYRLPIFWRAIGYFFYRYIVKLGFLDGKEGFLWDFYHAWWYRNLVDTKVEEIYKRYGKDSVAIKKYILETYNRKL